jgi:hypothetical protein
LCGRELRGRRAGRKRRDDEPPYSRRRARHGTGRRHETGQRLRRVGLEDPQRPQPVADAAMLRRGGIRGRLQPVMADGALADCFAQVVCRIAVQRCRQRRAHRQQDDEQAGRYGERASERAKHPGKGYHNGKRVRRPGTRRRWKVMNASSFLWLPGPRPRQPCGLSLRRSFYARPLLSANCHLRPGTWLHGTAALTLPGRWCPVPWMMWSDAWKASASARPYRTATSEGSLKSVATRMVLSAIMPCSSRAVCGRNCQGQPPMLVVARVTLIVAMRVPWVRHRTA